MSVRPAFQGELMLAGWTQNHTAGAKVSFWLPDDDALEAFKHMTARRGNTAGQRFMAVLVQIGDDEQPIEPGMDGGQRAAGLSRSAALLCKSADFQGYVATAEGWRSTNDPEGQATNFLRTTCCIDSRSELDSSPTAAVMYRRLLSSYSDWRLAKGMGSYERRDGE